MNKMGVKISVPGKDVLSANDSELSYNSQFDSALILEEGELELNGSIEYGQSVKFKEFDYGFVPAIMVFIKYYKDVTFGEKHLMEPYYSGYYRFYTKKDGAYIYGNDMMYYREKMIFRFYILNIDLEKNIEPIVGNLGVSNKLLNRGGDYELQLSRKGKDVLNCSSDDFLINSKSKSYMIHGVKNHKISTTGNYKFYHKLGYYPMVLTWVRPSGEDGFLWYKTIGAWYDLLTITKEYINYFMDDYYMNYDRMTMVVFKDSVL